MTIKDETADALREIADALAEHDAGGTHVDMARQIGNALHSVGFAWDHHARKFNPPAALADRATDREGDTTCSCIVGPSGDLAGGACLACQELIALANLIERPPLDDVTLTKSVALRTAKAIRALVARQPATDREEVTTITISVDSKGGTSFHSSIPSRQSWDRTYRAMQNARAEFERQFDESHLCPFAPARAALADLQAGGRDHSEDLRDMVPPARHISSEK